MLPELPMHSSPCLFAKLDFVIFQPGNLSYQFQNKAIGLLGKSFKYKLDKHLAFILYYNFSLCYMCYYGLTFEGPPLKEKKCSTFSAESFVPHSQNHDFFVLSVFSRFDRTSVPTSVPTSDLISQS